MDKRIGYGLSFVEAIELAIKSIPDLPGEYRGNIRRFSIGGGALWGELRDDGWRVYRAKTDEESHVSDKKRTEVVE